MMVLRKTIIKKSKKPFNLDPVLANLKDQSILASRQYNWGFLFAELKKFNIRHTQEQKKAIIEEIKHPLILDIVKKLQDYDTNLQAYQQPGVNQSQLGVNYTNPVEQYGKQNNSDLRGSYPNALASKNKYGSSLAIRKPVETNSEINYGNFSNQNEILEKRGKPLDIESHAGGINNFNDGRSEDLFPSISQNGRAVVNSKSSNILRAAPGKKQLLDPIGSGLEVTDQFATYAGVVSPNTQINEKSASTKNISNQKPII